MKTTKTKETRAQQLIKKLDPSYSLIYIDYRDDLSGKEHDGIIQEAIADNNLDAIREKIEEWSDEPRSDSIRQIIDDTYTEDEKEELDNDSDLRDEIRYAIEDRDNSDPARDILRNIGDRNYFYPLGDIEQDGISGCNIKDVKKAFKRAQIILSDADANELADNASYGGTAGILFRGDSDAFINNGKKYGAFTVDGAQAAIINYGNGSGHDISLKDPVRLKLDRSKIAIERYYVEDVCGAVLPSATITLHKGREVPHKLPEPTYKTVGNIIADDITMLHVRAEKETKCNGATFTKGHLYSKDIESWSDAPAHVREAVRKNGGWIAKIKYPTASKNYTCGYIAFNYAGTEVLAQKCIAHYEFFAAYRDAIIAGSNARAAKK